MLSVASRPGVACVSSAANASNSHLSQGVGHLCPTFRSALNWALAPEGSRRVAWVKSEDVIRKNIAISSPQQISTAHRNTEGAPGSISYLGLGFAVSSGRREARAKIKSPKARNTMRMIRMSDET